MRFDILTLFPDMFDAVTRYGITRRAIERGLAQLHCHQLRDYAHDAYKTIDDRPYGGGPGMVMMAGPLTEAVQDIRSQQQSAGLGPAPVVLMSPSGQPINQALVDRIATQPCWTIICGRYEGVDQRFIDQQVDELWSLGDFVLSGGEIAAMAVVDAAIRRLPGALGDEQSAIQESFSVQGPAAGLLDWPHYTRPEVFNGAAVPDVLLSGHHERIADWRRKAALEATSRHRPDLLHKPKSQ
ncbi:MAG: tRNA (guanosine(37)-N1)-methyltransferase TrmD [Burkholderiaceae bacterium]|nr:tRNA (guanosine(37)-N1)-methyltransferase TrmD [Burkholderiaceae bacterium]